VLKNDLCGMNGRYRSIGCVS